MTTRQPVAPKHADKLLADLRDLIESARQHVARAANATLTMLYWHIGQRIGVELLKKERAPYGQEIVYAVSRQLTLAYGKGFTHRNLWRLVAVELKLAREQATRAALPAGSTEGTP